MSSSSSSADGREGGGGAEEDAAASALGPAPSARSSRRRRAAPPARRRRRRRRCGAWRTPQPVARNSQSRAPATEVRVDSRTHRDGEGARAVCRQAHLRIAERGGGCDGRRPDRRPDLLGAPPTSSTARGTRRGRRAARRAPPGPPPTRRRRRGSNQEDILYSKSSALQIWLFGYEFPNTILVICSRCVKMLVGPKQGARNYFGGRAPAAKHPPAAPAAHPRARLPRRSRVPLGAQGRGERDAPARAAAARQDRQEQGELRRVAALRSSHCPRWWRPSARRSRSATSRRGGARRWRRRPTSRRSSSGRRSPSSSSKEDKEVSR